MQISQFANGEQGGSIRTKLNAVIDGVSVTGRTVTGATTLAATDDGDMVVVNSAGSVIVTLPNNLPVGFVTTVVQLGAGAVSFTAASGATRNSRGGLSASGGQYALMTVLVVANSGGAAASYILGGDLA